MRAGPRGCFQGGLSPQVKHVSRARGAVPLGPGFLRTEPLGGHDPQHSASRESPVAHGGMNRVGARREGSRSRRRVMSSRSDEAVLSLAFQTEVGTILSEKKVK